MRSSSQCNPLPKTVYTITVDVVNALMVERDMLKAQIEHRDSEIRSLRGRRPESPVERPASNTTGTSDTELTPRRETTYQYAVSALVHLMLGNSPAGIPNSRFRTQEAIVSALVAHYGDRLGIGERTLHGIFAAANKIFDPL